MTKAGSLLGSGAIIVMDETTNMVKVAHRISRFYYSESCGQCTPCREGTGWMYRIIDRILKGNGNLEDIKTLESIPAMIAGSTICALGDAAAMPVESFLLHYKNEFLKYIKYVSEQEEEIGVRCCSFTAEVGRERSEQEKEGAAAIRLSWARSKKVCCCCCSSTAELSGEDSSNPSLRPVTSHTRSAAHALGRTCARRPIRALGARVLT